MEFWKNGIWEFSLNMDENVQMSDIRIKLVWMSNESLKLWRILLYRTVIRIFYDSFNMTHARSEIIHRTEKPRFFLKFGPVRPFMLEKCSFQFQRKWSIENSKWKLNHVIFENFDVEIPSRINFNTFFQIQNFEIIFRQFLSDLFWKKKFWKKKIEKMIHFILLWPLEKQNSNLTEH